ncbi:MAG: hypothetical protein ABSB87_02170 [Terriglobales bacterium]|jgi:hypothetical protein
MRNVGDEIGLGGAQLPVVCQLGVSDFQQKVLEKLGQLEAKMDMVVGNGQPGRMQMAEERLGALEKNDLRRTIYDRIVIAGITFMITFAISAIVAWRDLLRWK